uniref:Uncharacterized protein n=1 Tax=Oryza punctata TaxID=4537 RepID=A0A0E0M6X0_ORYPU
MLAERGPPKKRSKKTNKPPSETSIVVALTVTPVMTSPSEDNRTRNNSSDSTLGPPSCVSHPSEKGKRGPEREAGDTPTGPALATGTQRRRGRGEVSLPPSLREEDRPPTVRKIGGGEGGDGEGEELEVEAGPDEVEPHSVPSLGPRCRRSARRHS